MVSIYIGGGGGGSNYIMGVVQEGKLLFGGSIVLSFGMDKGEMSCERMGEKSGCKHVYLFIVLVGAKGVGVFINAT